MSATRAKLADRLPRDAVPIGILILLPILLYVPFSLAGHPLLPGDDLVQNEPLRVLVGETIRSGRLPAWDPLIWSGTPLLAGWNAGAAFPGTWLFVFVGAIAAWTINFVAVPIVAATGVYVLVRRLDCGPLAALLSALVFTYTGFMSGQIVHIGLVEGTACTPWILIAIEGLSRATTRRILLRWTALLALSIALCITAGDPRAVSSAAIIGLIYTAAQALRLRGGTWRFLRFTIVGTALGVATSAIQWLPGISFLHASQRSTSAYAFFGSGSVAPSHVLSFLLAPFLLGGNGNLGLPTFEGGYNLPELTIGVGFIALVATSSYCRDVVLSLLQWFRIRQSRTSLSSRRLGVWFVLIATGALLTFGITTPLGHLLVHLPLYGGERLQNRNAVLFDLGFAVLLGFFVDDFIALNGARTRSALPPLSTRTSRLLGAMPGLFAVLLVLYAFVKPLSLEDRFSVVSISRGFFHPLYPYLITTLVLALVASAFALFQHRLSARTRLQLLAMLVLFDVALYVVNGDFATAPSSVLASSNPETNKLGQLDGGTGRFAIYNPSLVFYATGDLPAEEIGVSDLNVLQNHDSMQGYGSIVNGSYQDATATHYYEDLNTTGLVGTPYSILDLKTLLTLPIYIGTTLAANSPIPLPRQRAVNNDGEEVDNEIAPALPPGAVGPWTIASHASTSWQLPGDLAVKDTSVILERGPTDDRAQLAVSIKHLDKTISTQVASVVKAAAQVRFSHAASGTSISIMNDSSEPIEIEAVVADTRDPTSRYLLDGELQGSLLTPQWTYAGEVGEFLAYTNNETAGFAWLQPATDTTPDTQHLARGSVKVETNSPVAAQMMHVDAPTSTILARSEDYSPGWTARLTPVGGGKTLVLPVHPFGLIQAIDLPKGDFEVTWKYAPTDFLEGLWLSLAGVLAMIGITWVAFSRRETPATAVQSSGGEITD